MSFENKGQIGATAIVSQEPDRSGNFVLADSADVAGLQAAVDYVETFGRGALYLKQGVNIEGQIIITEPVSLITDHRVWDRGADNLPYVRQIKVDNTTADLDGILFRGISTRELHLDMTSGNLLRSVSFENGAIDKDATYRGLLIEADGDGGTGRLFNLEVFNSRINNDAGGDGTTYGCITFDSLSQGTGHIWLTDCEFACRNSNSSFYVVREDALCGSLYITNCEHYISPSVTGVNVFYQAAKNTSELQGMIAIMTAGRIEPHESIDLVEIVADADQSLIGYTFHNTLFDITSAKVVTYMNTANVNWAARSHFRVENCLKRGSGTFALGNIPNDANVFTRIANNEAMNPVGVIAQPFGTAMIVMTGGGAAVPTASTDYVVRDHDIKISSTDSGNTDAAILLKDESGGSNILQSALSTIDHMYVPRGFALNWGAFTGAAPTVTIAFA